MNIALDNIFKKPEPPVRHVKVVSKVGTDRWKVADVYSRTFFVDSTATWKKGDSVYIQSGKITERAPVLEDPNEYEV